jgi:hypothetical protein
MNDSRFNKTFIIQPALGSDSYLSGTTFDNNTIYYNTLSQKIDSKTINEPVGSDKVANIVSLTQAEYDAATPISTTFYIITD